MKKRSDLPNLPPGFSPDNFTPIDIKSVKKNKKGDFIVELKPDKEKEEGSIYHYICKERVYKIMRKKTNILTPNGTPCTTLSEPLAKKTVEHLNLYGEEYTQSYSIVSFIYSNIEFFEPGSKEDLDKPVLNDFKTDWTLRCPYSSAKEVDRWIKTFGDPSQRNDEFRIWLQGLTKFQTGAVVILGSSLESVNTGYILSHLKEGQSLEKFSEYYCKCFHAYHKKLGYSAYEYYSTEQMPRIFENYLFWQEL